MQTLSALPHALSDFDELRQHLAGRRPAIFLDYDGTLTPIVDRPEDALISPSMRRMVADLAERVPVCVVSGRDRPMVQALMGLDNLIVAGSHGFDIWSPDGGAIERAEGADFTDLLAEVTDQLQRETAEVAGALVEPKKASVAIHYRLVAPEQHPQIAALVQGILAAHPEELKVTPGKMVYEIQPKLDWDKGKAVLYLLEALHLDGDEILPIYLGDDITDEDAFRALNDRGIGIFVGQLDDPEIANHHTAADAILYNVDEVETFLGMMTKA
ncbi:MAG: trehalose-phosphatase [Caldilineaceae bacterium]|nr:trehalose-phosphatase [Caldilineaceae bacterium]